MEPSCSGSSKLRFDLIFDQFQVQFPPLLIMHLLFCLKLFLIQSYNCLRISYLQMVVVAMKNPYLNHLVGNILVAVSDVLVESVRDKTVFRNHYIGSSSF